MIRLLMLSARGQAETATTSIRIANQPGKSNEEYANVVFFSPLPIIVVLQPIALAWLSLYACLKCHVDVPNFLQVSSGCVRDTVNPSSCKLQSPAGMSITHLTHAQMGRSSSSSSSGRVSHFIVRVSWQGEVAFPRSSSWGHLIVHFWRPVQKGSGTSTSSFHRSWWPRLFS